MSDFSSATAGGGGAVAVAAPPTQQPDRLPGLSSLDFSTVSRADSDNSDLSQGSTSGTSEQAAQLQLANSGSGSGELEAAPSAGSFDSAAAGIAGAAASSGFAGAGGAPVKKDDAKSSALKALAGVSAIVSKSRKVDAEALQAIKSQRAKARAEGHTPAQPGAAAATSSGGRGNTPPPPAGADGASGTSSSVGVSPFASASSQGLVRSPSASNLAAALHNPHGTATITQATSLPINMHSRPRRSPVGTPPAAAADYEPLVAKMTITELVALKQAVEAQLAKQAMALAQLQASSQRQPHTDMLSQQYAALLLQNAQQAQLVQQLNSQQQQAHAAAIQQALSAAAAAAGITSPSFSPEQLLLSQAQQAQQAAGSGMAQYGGVPMPDMSSPFASAPFPADATFGLGDAASTAPHAAMSLAGAAAPGTAGSAAGSKSSGSPRSASAEQQLIGEALHSFVDPERQGPPSRQGSALVNGINWSDRRAGPAVGAFARSRSLPHPPEGLYQDRSPSLNAYLASGADGAEQLSSLFNGLRMEGLAEGGGGGAPPSAFTAARAGSLQVPMQRVSFNDSVQTRTFQPSY